MTDNPKPMTRRKPIDEDELMERKHLEEVNTDIQQGQAYLEDLAEREFNY
jgi:hypothetical protein